MSARGTPLVRARAETEPPGKPVPDFSRERDGARRGRRNSLDWKPGESSRKSGVKVKSRVVEMWTTQLSSALSLSRTCETGLKPLYIMLLRYYWVER